MTRFSRDGGRDTFSREVKQELCRTAISGKSEAFWEAYALHHLLATSRGPEDTTLSAEPYVLRRLLGLVKHSGGAKLSLARSPGVSKANSTRYQIAARIEPKNWDPSTRPLFENKECRRAYLRGAFIARGSIISPVSGHHLEFALHNRKDASFIKSLLEREGFKPGLVKRRSCWVVYIKDGDSISDLLKLLGSTQCVLEYENARAKKSLKSSVQRLVNMDRANVSRSVEASMRQIEEIRFIEENMGLFKLPEALRELAYLRLENPDMSMEELGESLNPPISKSAVNHRFRRISEISKKLRARLQDGQQEQ